MPDLEGDRPGGAPPAPKPMPNSGPPRVAYPALPDHVMERLSGYIGPGLRNQMARLREAEHVKAA